MLSKVYISVLRECWLVLLFVMSMLQMAAQFVEGVTEFRNAYFVYVEKLFCLHPLFLAALDKVSFCNHVTLLSI